MLALSCADCRALPSEIRPRVLTLHEPLNGSDATEAGLVEEVIEKGCGGYVGSYGWGV